MGRQVRFFMDSDDEREFIDFVRTTGDVALLVDPSPKPVFDPVNDLPDQGITRFWTRVWLYNRRVSHNFVSAFVPNLGYYTVDGLRSSVVEFDRTVQSGGVIRPGRLWAEFRYADPEGKRWIAKENEFKRWYETLARWIRKNYSREIDPDFYAGPGALKLTREGKVQVKYF